MALKDWVAATATPATPATHGQQSRRTVATVATVAVADSANTPIAALSATPEQAAELRALVAIFLANDTEAERVDAMTAALVDPVDALTSFLLLAAEHVEKQRASDDLRCCTECANLSRQDRRCLAAWRGERIGNAGRNYHPAIDVPGRCASYTPKLSDEDQRPGSERWPVMVQDNQRLRDMANPQTFNQSNRQI